MPERRRTLMMHDLRNGMGLANITGNTDERVGGLAHSVDARAESGPVSRKKSREKKS
jgi:hypothetical protein